MFTKKLYTNVYNSFIHYTQELEKAQMPSNKWVSQQTVVQRHHLLLFNNKKERTIDAGNDLDESPENYAEVNKPVPKSHILYDSI